MALRDIQVPRRTVSVPGGEFSVRGLSLLDVNFLLDRHGEALATLFEDLIGKPQAPGSPMRTVLERSMQGFPRLAAEIVAIAADEADAIDIVADLPFVSQLEALEAVAELTFTTDDSLKKVGEIVMKFIQGTSKLVPNSP